MSRPSATFASPCLSYQQTFDVAAVECWALKPREEDPYAETKPGGTVMDRFKEQTAFMEMSGLHKGYSHGVQDAAPHES